MQQEITVLALDFGNVLGTFDHMQACAKIARATMREQEEIYDLYFGNHAEILRLIGRENGNGLYRRVSRECDLDLSYQWFQDVWGSIFTPAPTEVAKILSRVFTRVRMLLVSNTEELHWEKIKDLPSVRPFFSVGHQALSFRLGFCKPEREYYEKVLAMIDARPEEVLYIDDIPEYVDVFKQMGGWGEVFNVREHTPAHLEHLLTRYGLLL